MAAHTIYKDLVGHVFGRLTVQNKVTRINARGHNERYWQCLCLCGTEAITSTSQLVNGKAKSCGCLRREVSRARETTHGAYSFGRETPEHMAWRHMKERCSNPSDDSFQYYGAKGITVCERWESYANFIADMGPRPHGMTLERRENHIGYGPGNCRWATAAEQCRNRSMTVWLTLNGKTMCVADWAIAIGMQKQTLHARLNAGWSVERTLTTPVRKWPHARTSATRSANVAR